MNDQQQVLDEAPQTYAADDRGLFCCHCGRTTWLHRLVRGVGFTCLSRVEAGT